MSSFTVHVIHETPKHSCFIKVRPSMTSYDVKKLIQLQTSIPITQQCLVINEVPWCSGERAGDILTTYIEMINLPDASFVEMMLSRNKNILSKTLSPAYCQKKTLSEISFKKVLRIARKHKVNTYHKTRVVLVKELYDLQRFDIDALRRAARSFWKSMDLNEVCYYCRRSDGQLESCVEGPLNEKCGLKYHVACCGFCQRHHCCVCDGICQFRCQYCVTAYCAKHSPVVKEGCRLVNDVHEYVCDICRKERDLIQ